MYNAVFEADNGRKYVFGIDGKTAFDMDIGSGVSVDIGTSQGFLQVGETVENYTISGRPIEVKGAIYNDIPKRKKEMRGVFAPFVSGKLTIQGKYFIRVYVKETPTFSPKNDDGRFTMVLFAPYPYFYDVNEVVKTVGTIKPTFSFPINYATPHKFGERVGESYINLLNEGDVNAPIDVYIRSSGSSKNPELNNLKTFKKLKLNGELVAGDVARIYRDNGNVLRAELLRDGVTTDIISWVDEKSDLYELEVGTNLISVTDDEGGANLTVNVKFNPVLVAVYED